MALASQYKTGPADQCVYYILESTMLEISVRNSVLFISAFDMVHDPMAALETLLTLGFERVLTSGCDSSALEGLPLIKRLIDQVHSFFLFFLILCCGYSWYSVVQLGCETKYYWLYGYSIGKGKYAVICNSYFFHMSVFSNQGS